MHLLSSLLFALSANTDNFVVGLSYGIKRIKIKIISNFLIATISLFGTIVSMLMGRIIINLIPRSISNSLGSIILIIIGSWTIIKTLIEKSSNGGLLDNPEKADLDMSASIDAKESIALAFALTINNLGLGIGASITGLNIIITSLFTFIFSILTIIIGYSLGSNFLSNIFSKKATIVSGLIIIILGIYEILI